MRQGAQVIPHRLHAILFSDADRADAIQEAVFRGWMKKDDLREEECFETRLIRILTECRNLLHRGRELSLTQPSQDSVEDVQLDFTPRAALRTLPEKYRVPMLLHHMEGID